MLYIATDGGIGRWDYTISDWANPLTISDGLPTNVVEDVQFIGTDLWIATTAGVVKMDTLTNATTLYSSGTGLMATSAQSLTSSTTTTVVNGTSTTSTSLFHRPRWCGF
jgi:ligand-binding sensor domain-containing protein